MNSNLADRVTPYTDIIDSRDVIELIEQLEGEIEALKEEKEELKSKIGELQDERDETENDRMDDEISELYEKRQEIDVELEELQEQLDPLEALEVEGSSISSDWEYGEALIADSYFQEYAQDLAEDLGYINKEVSWPYTCIDWEQAANDLKQDYSCVDFAGQTFWIRG